jgi:hypothetical protein
MLKAPLQRLDLKIGNVTALESAKHVSMSVKCSLMAVNSGDFWASVSDNDAASG